MRISDTVAPLGIFLVGLGLASALAFDGARSPNDLAPAVSTDVVPRTALTAMASPLVGTPFIATPPLVAGPPPATAEQVVAPVGPLGFPGFRLQEPVFKLTPMDAFHWGLQALRFGNIPAGVRALEFSAASGHPLAQWKLGRMYADADGIPQDEARAFEYFRAIVDAHAEEAAGTRMGYFVANSMVSLATYYLEGIPNSDVKSDPERARQMFAYAATYYGDRDAQYHLAQLYIDGNGVTRDPKVAARWLNLAADKGQYQAQAVLGDMLFKDGDAPRRRALGLMWLTLARDSATPQDAWIAQLHDAAAKKATDDERAMALTLLERRLKGERE
jgi:uncharacterized protein